MRIFKYPEQMTPGSFWKIKGVKGMRYVESRQVIGAKFKGWNTSRWARRHGLSPHQPTPSLKFELKTPYMLVKFKQEGGMIAATFLVGDKVVHIQIFESFWDKAFRLARKSNFPKEAIEYQNLFDKYDVGEVKRQLGIEHEDIPRRRPRAIKSKCPKRT